MASDGQPGIGKKLSAISEDRVPFFTDLVKTISGKERNPVLEDISEPEVQINIIHLKADTFKITGKNRIPIPRSDLHKHSNVYMPAIQLRHPIPTEIYASRPKNRKLLP